MYVEQETQRFEVHDEVLQQWLGNIGNLRGKAGTFTATKKAASAEPRKASDVRGAQTGRRMQTRCAGQLKAGATRPQRMASDVYGAGPASTAALFRRWLGGSARTGARGKGEGRAMCGERQRRGRGNTRGEWWRISNGGSLSASKPKPKMKKLNKLRCVLRSSGLCGQQRRELRIASLQEKGGIKAEPQPPYLSPINNDHVDLGFSGPAKGRAVTRAMKGMASIQTELVLERGEVDTQQTRQLPARHAWAVHRAAVQLHSSSAQEGAAAAAGLHLHGALLCFAFGWPNAGMAVGTHELDGWRAVALVAAVGAVPGKARFLGAGSRLSSAVQAYIDPTIVRDTDLDFYFVQMTWSR
ncbi:hypothetical protein CYMTET_33344 [Cymbomonas tetramitiformis]|uniref:Uncharacterized protein n=1 Tax=Cymbomonas tetramitiformis TaxID=36881 RepID=A0AAE0FD72_9CHLO|nr:hypothetical protein CYMTET_33344 [Cymbomonas tetramitiformis]